MINNLILKTDSYKLTHWAMMPDDTESVYSYCESRVGAAIPYTVFFGLQYLIKEYLVGTVVTQQDIEEAEVFVEAHMGSKELFNRVGWEHIVNHHHGTLPLSIKAVPEGTALDSGNVLMTVESTDPECYWLTNYVETLLLHIWYPSTVASLSCAIKHLLMGYLEKTGDTSAIDFMLHDFGYRGATSDEAAGIGGAGHLINFKGTDTIAAMSLLVDYYYADIASLAFSVPASEHSVMTALGISGEIATVQTLLERFPTGILSVVADSYSIYEFVSYICSIKDQITARDGRFVLRPDSITPEYPTPEDLTLHILETLWTTFGGETNEKGYRILDTHIRILWGDGIDMAGVDKILEKITSAGYAADNMVFGMGGALLQKINRDTQRFAFKSSAQKRNGNWYDVVKTTLDPSKASKGGKLMLNREADGTYVTRPQSEENVDLLEVVFHNGRLVKEYSFDEIRQNALV